MRVTHYLNSRCKLSILWGILFFLSPVLLFANQKASFNLREGANILKWELGLVVGGSTYLGLKNWNWGSANHFKMNNEDWFGMDTGSGGTDKLGHMYTTYLMDEFFTHRLFRATNNWKESARLSAYFSGAIMLFVEMFDGYSDDHGFSKEDVIMNFTGIGLSYLRNTVPGLKEKFDFRVEYQPTKNHRNRYLTDYSGMTYIAAIKPAGFQSLRSTPLKYVEFQLGYHADGFKASDIGVLDRKRTELTIGLSLNLGEVLFQPLSHKYNNKLTSSMDTFFDYYQLPNSTIKSVVYKREIKH